MEVKAREIPLRHTGHFYIHRTRHKRTVQKQQEEGGWGWTMSSQEAEQGAGLARDDCMDVFYFISNLIFGPLVQGFTTLVFFLWSGLDTDLNFTQACVLHFMWSRW